MPAKKDNGWASTACKGEDGTKICIVSDHYLAEVAAKEAILKSEVWLYPISFTWRASCPMLCSKPANDGEMFSSNKNFIRLLFQKK